MPASAAHVGKIVIDLRDNEIEARPAGAESDGRAATLRVAASDAPGDEPVSAGEHVRSAGAGIGAPGDEPIAVVGIGCRLPGGASSPATFWELLRAGTDAIRAVPAERWCPDDVRARAGDMPGLVAARWGGFLDQIDGFDAAFFGVTATEAQSMDPQRLLLEVAWEALEDGGLPPGSLRGSRTGVFGNTFSIAAGRISYVLGLTGPSIAVDTACSSSLTAVHLACQSLRTGECDMAMAGGVNLIIEPHAGVSLGRMEALASDGRCKPFDAAADGIVRSEGCDVVVLKPLGAALRDGDRVYALIRGSASNQDGRSNGLTAPNGRAQRELIRLALARARVAPADVGFMETHGTGTRLGDPIEVHALGDVLGTGRDPARPVIIGAAKSNIGHTEACAGIAGLIKVSAGGAARDHPGQPALSPAQPAHRLETLVGRGGGRADALAVEPGRAPHCRRELVRLQRHQRARHPRGAARHHRPRAWVSTIVRRCRPRSC